MLDGMQTCSFLEVQLSSRSVKIAEDVASSGSSLSLSFIPRPLLDSSPLGGAPLLRISGALCTTSISVQPGNSLAMSESLQGDLYMLWQTHCLFRLRGVAAGPAGPALAGPLSHTPKTKQKNQNPQVKE